MKTATSRAQCSILRGNRVPRCRGVAKKRLHSVCTCENRSSCAGRRPPRGQPWVEGSPLPGPTERAVRGLLSVRPTILKAQCMIAREDDASPLLERPCVGPCPDRPPACKPRRLNAAPMRPGYRSDTARISPGYRWNAGDAPASSGAVIVAASAAVVAVKVVVRALDPGSEFVAARQRVASAKVDQFAREFAFEQ